ARYRKMNVEEKMACGLKMRKCERTEIGTRVQEAAEILGIQNLLKRKPRQLSGGQRQRVALGRAIVRHPRVFLFDEPLSNLDAKLRVQMRVELKKLHQRLGTTAVYVTHDQVEAMTLGDRVIVMRDGLVQRVAEPLDLYTSPANRFVAGFIGSPAMNFASVTMMDGNGRLTAKNAGLELEVPASHAERLRSHIGREVTMGIRPENLHVATETDAPGLTFPSKVEVVEQLGSEILLDVRVGNDTMVAAVDPTIRARVQDQIRLAVNPARLHFFDAKTEMAI